MSLVLNVEILGEFKKLSAATTGAEKSLKTLQGKVSTISSRISSSLATIGIGFGVAAVVGGIKDTISAASDQEQQFGALEAVFGNLSGRMKEFASNQNSIGLNTADAARQMALLGSQLKGVGMPIDQVADKTESLIGLAADLAATYGGTTAGAVDSISSLFRGEFDPIEKYGVAIKQSDINAKLAAEGLDTLTGEALKTAKAQAALELLFTGTADAQGQAAREAGTYASQNAALTSKFDDLQAEIGQKLLPIMVELMESINDNWDAIEDLLKKLGDFVVWILKEGLPAIAKLVDNVGGFGALAILVGGLAGSMQILNGRFLLFAASNPALAGALIGIGLIAAAMYTVYQNTKNATEAMDTFTRNQGIQKATSNPIATPEQINAATYRGILEVGQKPVVPPVSTKQTPLKGGSSGKVSGGTVVNNITNVTVKKSTATGKDIATAINKVIKSSGTNVIKAM